MQVAKLWGKQRNDGVYEVFERKNDFLFVDTDIMHRWTVKKNEVENLDKAIEKFLEYIQTEYDVEYVNMKDRKYKFFITEGEKTINKFWQNVKRANSSYF